MATQKKKKRRKLTRYLLGSLVFLSLLVIVNGLLGSTWALNRNTESKPNDFSVGDVKATLVEEFTSPTKTEVDQAYTKKVTVKNTGEAPIFIRVLVVPQILSKKDVTGNQLLLPATIGTEVQLDLNTTDWVDGEDGYYYYLKPVDTGKESAQLFSSVTLSNLVDESAYDGAKLTIDVKVESINVTKWAYQDAWWNGDAIKWSTGVLKTIDDSLKVYVTN
ncbi:hypothetical protein I6N95_15030 [Vagococcus sp. BWB3-3]|uniref:Alternate signal-mediated exported protein n=1 Tax=Vagococcus allomyrinae TaxID=2794353 RepID=A0A940PD21_9ENTE|nr:hypothetical protein [Vagococcus allomyrinae]MBP1042332.1 hypothetical protein [Vagococcus allomyrinae]